MFFQKALWTLTQVWLPNALPLRQLFQHAGPSGGPPGAQRASLPFTVFRASGVFANTLKLFMHYSRHTEKWKGSSFWMFTRASQPPSQPPRHPLGSPAESLSPHDLYKYELLVKHQIWAPPAAVLYNKWLHIVISCSVVTVTYICTWVTPSPSRK